MEPAERFSPAPTDSPSDLSPPRSPFGDMSQSPRLGIIHLMVGTALVACYFSVVQSLATLMAEPGDTFEWTWGTGGMALLRGLGAWLSLGGLLLLVARTRRGMRFPIHPGETLWILLGVASLFSAVFDGLAILNFQLMQPGQAFLVPQHVLWQVQSFGYSTLFGVLCFLAARRTKAGRWRIFFYFEAARRGISLLTQCAGLAFWYWPFQFRLGSWAFLLAGAVLVAILVMDLRQRQRYPWSHWMGVALYLWSWAIMLGWDVYYSMLRW